MYIYKGNETTRSEILRRLYEKKSAGEKEAEAAAGRAWHSSRASALELNRIKLIGKEWHCEAGGEEVEAMKQRAMKGRRSWHREAAGEEVESVKEKGQMWQNLA